MVPKEPVVVISGNDRQGCLYTGIQTVGLGSSGDPKMMDNFIKTYLQEDIQPAARILSNIFPWVVPHTDVLSGGNSFSLIPNQGGIFLVEAGSIVFGTPNTHIKVFFEPGNLTDTIGAISCLIGDIIKKNPDGFLNSPFFWFGPPPDLFLVSPTKHAQKPFKWENSSSRWVPGPWTVINTPTNEVFPVITGMKGMPTCIGDYFKGEGLL